MAITELKANLLTLTERISDTERADAKRDRAVEHLENIVSAHAVYTSYPHVQRPGGFR